MKFNKIFENLYHSMNVEICPSEVDAKVYYAKAHHPDVTPLFPLVCKYNYYHDQTINIYVR